jgi:hypothetical protein
MIIDEVDIRLKGAGVRFVETCFLTRLRVRGTDFLVGTRGVGDGPFAGSDRLRDEASGDAGRFLDDARSPVVLVVGRERVSRGIRYVCGWFCSFLVPRLWLEVMLNS